MFEVLDVFVCLVPSRAVLVGWDSDPRDSAPAVQAHPNRRETRINDESSCCNTCIKPILDDVQS